jgi:hypothetical protein
MSERIALSSTGPSRRSCARERGQERRDPLYSGTWRCRLDTLTPLSIRSLFERLSANGYTAFVPGTSVRGMVRNVVEIVGNGCALVGCSEAAACLACRMFGFVAGNFVWQSKVRFSDSAPVVAIWARYDVSVPPAGPLQGDGRIVFPVERCDPWAGSVPFAPAGVSFPFTVDYLNLDAEEYAVFKYALTLEDGGEQLCHMLGFGKSLGFGACTVTILEDTSPPVGPEFDLHRNRASFQRFRQLRQRSRLA